MATLQGTTVIVADGGPASGTDGVPLVLTFSDGTQFRTEHWQIIEAGHEGLGSCHHHCQCCMPAPVDPIDQLRDILGDRPMLNMRRHADEVLVSFDGGIDLWLRTTPATPPA